MEECTNCGKPFLVTEHKLQMPGTKERENVYCPYCNHVVAERSSNGWWDSHKLTEEQIKEYFDNKSNNRT